MVQFIPEGPDLPLDVLEAHEDGRLALFCGAGVSLPAGLPLFGPLVEQVRGRFGANLSPLEKAAYDFKDYDRVLGLLEERYGFAELRRAVAELLQTPANPVLDTHRALLDLATSRDGSLHLVTTNFDLLFECADPSAPAAAAPMLPVPKLLKWNHLVHLHGRLDRRDPEGRNLVLTSADFGVAYLVERWASRFVAELFNHFSVLFVGYSVDDPVMRYLIDAIAAERRGDERIHVAYALAPYSNGQREGAEALWKAKRIVPIPYDDSGEHQSLYRTVKAWARLWRGGLRSKLNLVSEIATRLPVSRDTEVAPQLCWALRDSSGAAARTLGDLGTEARLEWLPILEEAGLLAFRAASDPDDVVIQLVGGNEFGVLLPLDAVREGISNWLASHLGSPELARWVISKGGRLHTSLSEKIQWRLRRDTTVPSPLRKVWYALTGSIPLLPRVDAYHRSYLHERIGSEEWSPRLRVEVLEALSPCAELKRSWDFSHPGEPEFGQEETDRPIAVSSILAFDCELLAGPARQSMLGDLRSREDWPRILGELAFDLASLLRSALDLHAALDNASSEADLSCLQHPSIRPHEQNRFDFHGWTTLIDLNREALDHLAQSDHGRARTLVKIWKQIAYPVFRRLVLYAATLPDLNHPNEILDLLKSNPRDWIWSGMVQLELFACLPSLWGSLEEDERVLLFEALREGPPRDMYRSDLDTAEWEALRDRAIWERLVRLSQAGPPLGEEGGHILHRLEEANPSWRLTSSPSEGFATWMESSWGQQSDFTADELLEMTEEDLTCALREHRSNRGGLLDAWREAAGRNQERAIRVLTRLLDESYLDIGVWGHGLGALWELTEGESLRTDLVELLLRIPSELAGDAEISHPVAAAVRALARNASETLRPRLLRAWDRALARSRGVAQMNTDERVTAAINHPTGILAEGLMEILRSDEPERGDGIPEDVRRRLEALLEMPAPEGGLGRTIISSRLPLLFDLDPEWTRERVVRFFSWQNLEEARGAWQGFLWSPFLRPSLWAHLKPYFLDAFHHLEELDGQSSGLAGLLASIAIDGHQAITDAEARACLSLLSDADRATVAMWIDRKLEGAEDRAPMLWRESIGPWIQCAWPRELNRRGEGASARLASAVIRTADAFPEAVEAILPILCPVQRGYMIIDRLREANHLQNYPRSALSLLSSLIGDEPPGWFGELGRFLDELEQTAPNLGGDPSFRRLRELSTQRGL